VIILQSGSSGSAVLGPPQPRDRQARRKEKRWFRVREMVGPFHAPGAAASTRRSSGSRIIRARNTKRSGTSGGGRKQEGEARHRTPFRRKGTQTRCIAFGNPIRPWAVGQRVRPMNHLRRTLPVDATWLGCWTGGGSVRNVHAPEGTQTRSIAFGTPAASSLFLTPRPHPSVRIPGL